MINLINYPKSESLSESPKFTESSTCSSESIISKGSESDSSSLEICEGPFKNEVASSRIFLKAKPLFVFQKDSRIDSPVG
jgi:hypothetical protein